MKRTKYTVVEEEIRETKDLLINGYIITLVKSTEKHRPLACYMGMKGWALQSMIKMKRTTPPKTMKRTR